MNAIFTLFVSLILSFGLLGCSSQNSKEPLKISATTWIGYTPLFYAKEMGWLEKSNIKLINVVSLSENMYLYKAGNADAYVGTQYEHSVLKDDMPSLVPIMLFDRSYGGDMVMSNVPIETIQKSDKTINVYLEMDSINFTMLEDFIKTYKIDEKRINYINRDQNEIASLKKIDKSTLTLVVTYIPYDSVLKKQGFKKLLSTKESLDLLVVDAMFTKVGTLAKHKEQFLALKSYVNQAIDVLHSDPKAFYKLIEPYMDHMSYDEFITSLNDIQWIHKELSNDLQKRMNTLGFSIKDIL
jgi:NitT/TauT family transport system substrate-binding protein